MGGRLTSLVRGLPPSLPPASESAPTESEASSSSWESVGGQKEKEEENLSDWYCPICSTYVN
ncbi:hypothetical protein [Candidatus Ichthyocystis sparus]|uniref:hypothetical protein n=1 Tax=Candidatus Ichthyocystis sparus TaxID=1561004 RepID=UPI000B896BA4|nr:hypothetical protein [Candidatus Ichthyocystis sparus]